MHRLVASGSAQNQIQRSKACSLLAWHHRQRRIRSGSCSYWLFCVSTTAFFYLGVEPFLTFVSSTCRALVFLMQVQTYCLHRSSSVSHVCNGSVVFGIYVSYTVQLQRYSFDSYASTFPHQSSPLPAYKDAPHLYPPVHYEKVPMIGKGGSCSLGGNVATECKSMATLVAEHGVGT